jgi:hypothetical protein
MLAILYCARCYENIRDSGEMVTILYEHICESFVRDNEPIEMSIEKGPEAKELKRFTDCLYVLETRGYVVSTEAGKFLLKIKPVGHSQHEEKHHFCIRNGCHD